MNKLQGCIAVAGLLGALSLPTFAVDKMSSSKMSSSKMKMTPQQMASHSMMAKMTASEKKTYMAMSAAEKKLMMKLTMPRRTMSGTPMSHCKMSPSGKM